MNATGITSVSTIFPSQTHGLSCLQFQFSFNGGNQFKTKASATIQPTPTLKNSSKFHRISASATIQETPNFKKSSKFHRIMASAANLTTPIFKNSSRIDRTGASVTKQRVPTLKNSSKCHRTRASVANQTTHTFTNSSKIHKIRASATIQAAPNVKKSLKIRKIGEKEEEKTNSPLSLPLHSKNPTAIYRDIKRFCRQGKLKEALIILDYTENRGIPVNVTTFSALIAACIRSKSLSEGKQIHVHIRINGLEQNEFLCTGLIQMYTACGSIEDAQKLFDEIPQTSVFPWNALLRGTVINGRHSREVSTVFAQMREMGVEPNIYSFSCLIKSCAGSPALNQGKKIHAHLIKIGLCSSNSILIQTVLVDLYFKCGKIRLARQLFDEMPQRDVVAWGTVIAGFAHNRLPREALEHFWLMQRDGFKPNSVIITIVLSVCGELSDLKLGKEIHGFVIRNKNYSKQIFIQSGLIDTYCKCGDMASGRRVFYGSKERNAISWTALISGYISNGRLEQALRSIVWMQQEGFKPDVVSIATILPVCADLQALKQGKEIHGYALKNGFLPNVSLITSLIVMYSKCGSLQSSWLLFEGMERRNVICWTAMIESFIRNGRIGEALQVFRSMQGSPHRPDSVTMATALGACGELQALKLGREIHGQILKKDLGSIPFVSGAIMKMYGRCRVAKTARLVFDQIGSKGLITWTAIIEAHGSNDRWREALDLFDRMMVKGFDPNHFTFDVILSICERAGLEDEALRIFDLMVQSYDIRATEEHYSSIVGLLNRAGRTEEAERFIRLRSVADTVAKL